MKRIRLQVALLPWVQHESQSSCSVQPSQEPLKPWLHVCTEEITLEELANQIVQKFSRIYAGLGHLTIRHLESDYGELLDLTDTVGDVFDDRAPSGESRTSIVRVACLPPNTCGLGAAPRFESLTPESSARPGKRSLQYFSPSSLQNPTSESWSSERSSVTLGRANKRQKRNANRGVKYVHESELEDAFDSSQPAVRHTSVQMLGSQQNGQWSSAQHSYKSPASLHVHQPVFQRNSRSKSDGSNYMQPKLAVINHEEERSWSSEILHDLKHDRTVCAESPVHEELRPKTPPCQQTFERHFAHNRSRPVSPRLLSSPRSGSPQIRSRQQINIAALASADVSSCRIVKPQDPCEENIDLVGSDSAAFSDTSDMERAKCSASQLVPPESHSPTSSISRRAERETGLVQKGQSREEVEPDVYLIHRSNEVERRTDERELNDDAQCTEAKDFAKEQAKKEKKENGSLQNERITEDVSEDVGLVTTEEAVDHESHKEQVAQVNEVEEKKMLKVEAGLEAKRSKALEGKHAAEKYLAKQRAESEQILLWEPLTNQSGRTSPKASTSGLSSLSKSTNSPHAVDLSEELPGLGKGGRDQKDPNTANRLQNRLIEPSGNLKLESLMTQSRHREGADSHSASSVEIESNQFQNGNDVHNAGSKNTSASTLLSNAESITTVEPFWRMNEVAMNKCSNSRSDAASTTDAPSIVNENATSRRPVQQISGTESLNSISELSSEGLTDSEAESDPGSMASSPSPSIPQEIARQIFPVPRELENREDFKFPILAQDGAEITHLFTPPRPASPPVTNSTDYEETANPRVKSVRPANISPNTTLDQLTPEVHPIAETNELQVGKSKPERFRYPRFSEIVHSTKGSPPPKSPGQTIKSNAIEQIIQLRDDKEKCSSDSDESSDSFQGFGTGLKGLRKLATIGQRVRGEERRNVTGRIIHAIKG